MTPPPDARPMIALPADDEDVATLRRALVAKLTYAVGKDPIVASQHDWFVATALTVRDRSGSSAGLEGAHQQFERS